MEAFRVGVSVIAAVVVISVGSFLAPIAFAERVPPGIVMGTTALTGLPVSDLAPALAVLDQTLRQQSVIIQLNGQQARHTVGELGVTLDINASAAKAAATQWTDIAVRRGSVAPVLTTDASQLQRVIQKSFGGSVTPPRNATLEFTAGQNLRLVPAVAGDGVHIDLLEGDIVQAVQTQQWDTPLDLQIIQTPPAVTEQEVDGARSYATALLGDGLTLRAGDRTWQVPPSTVRRMITFVEQVDPNQRDNHVLGVAFAPEALAQYLTTTLAPDIDQPAIDARFERLGERVEQFAVPQEGRELDVADSAKNIASSAAKHAFDAELAVNITTPAVTDLADIQALGITDLLATGTTDFVGSPKNRVHNIVAGTSRYHGLLIPQGTEFSFNSFLGPVDGEHGFLPELVIKNNTTTPEFGGGLCQVSTTVFRAAVQAGLEITARRNHAYAVRYYGVPGFDATIYPPYTDLRFKNNTPGYILIQARVTGTKLSFEFWGTDDGREVQVTGPATFDRQPDGAVKATLQQKVIKDGNVVIDETFYSRYKSPSLFPKVLATDDPTSKNVPSGNAPVASPTPKPNVTPKPSPKISPHPTPTAEP